MTILLLNYRPDQLLGKAIGSTLIVYQDKDGDNQFDPNEMLGMGHIGEEVRAIGAVGRWDGTRIVWPGGGVVADPRIAVIEARWPGLLDRLAG